MKKRIKKTIALLTLTVAVLGSSMTTMAASCLNVRDYGRHRHNHRVLSVSESNVVMGITDGKIHVVVTKSTTGYCVCGERGTDVEIYDKYVPVP